jgi:DNA-binding NtrC family response regulator
VSSSAEPQPVVATVLVIAVDPNIEALLGQLVVFAGHRPVYDVTGGAGGESIRRIRPDVALVDTALPHAVVEACLFAAEEVGSRSVLTSGTDSASELAEEARADHCPYFPLPGGPRPLASVLERELAVRVAQPRVAHDDVREAVFEGQRREALRGVMTDYAKFLNAADVPYDKLLRFVRNAISDCASVMGADAALPALLVESEEWARQACAA